MLTNCSVLSVGVLPSLLCDYCVHNGKRVVVGKTGTLEEALVVDKHGLLLLDLRHELKFGRLVSEFLAIFAGLLLLLDAGLFLPDCHFLHKFELIIIIRTMDEERREEEWLNMRSRGLNSNDVFPSKERIVYVQLRDPSDDGLRSEGFQMTDRNIYHRKIEAQGKPIGYEILHRQRNQLQSVRTGADYISQGLRTIALETRDIISDLIQLDKLLKAKEFEDSSAIIP